LKTINFIFGVHNHQPVGNFEYVFEDAYRQCYLPFIETLEEFPEIHISLHYSGCLLEWIEERHPEFIDKIVSVVSRGNVEILSGGFYEPILAMIPESDIVGQILMLNKYIKSRFKYIPEGLWLTERVWEPHLAKPISESGIKYIAVDDYHFISNGYNKEKLTGYFLTEHQGRKLGIFPISQDLRYAIPFKEPEYTIEYLRKYATEDGNNAIVMADDGEKFGVWPGTYQTSYEEKWLRRFFQALIDNTDWLKTKTFSEYFNNYPPKGRVYLPTASYFEMSEWSLTWEAGEKFGDLIEEFKNNGRFEELVPFLKGGMWRNFLSKYAESNWMQKKLFYLSNNIQECMNKKNSKYRASKLREARKHLWRGMCNCAYWHGIFGGLYLPHLRDAIYRELLTCEKLLVNLDQDNVGKFKSIDIDCDGFDEILFNNGKLSLAFSPAKGGIIEEFSILDKKINLLNTMSRYREAYHSKLRKAKLVEESEIKGSIHDMVVSKEKNIDKYLSYDKYLRKILIDHFIKPDVNIEDFTRGSYYEDSSFINGRFDAVCKGSTITMVCNGLVNRKKFRIKKIITIGTDNIKICYDLKNIDDSENSFKFGPEFNFAMSRKTGDVYYVTKDGQVDKVGLNFQGIKEQLRKVSIIDEERKFSIHLSVENSMEFWIFPVETVSISESGFERIYQSSAVIPWIEMNLEPNEKTRIIYELSIFNLP